MSQEKLLSLCMITYNDEKYLADCIALMKEVADEIIIADLGSTDQTISIAERENAKIYSVEWENDFSKLKNFCMEKAKGRWILFLQPNEIISKEHLSEIKKLLSNPNVEAYLLYVDYNIEDYMLFSPVQSLRLFKNREEYRFKYPTFERIPDEVLSNIEDANIQIVNCNINTMSWDLNLRLELLQKEIDNYSDDSYMQYIYGMVLLNNQAFEESIPHFKKAYENVNIGCFYAPHLYKYLAWNHTILNQIDEAFEVLGKGIMHFPYYTDFFAIRAELYRQIKQYPEAVLDLETCLSIRERPAFLVPGPEIGVDVVVESLASIYEDTFNYDEALEYYLQAYEANNTNQELLYKVCELANVTNNVEVMEKFQNEVVMLDDTFEDYDLELAKNFLLQNNLLSVIEVYHNILDIEKRKQVKEKLIGLMLYYNKFEMALKFMATESISLSEEAELVLWSNQQMKELLSLVSTMQSVVVKSKSSEIKSTDKALIKFYTNLVAPETKEEILPLWQIHARIGDYFDEKSMKMGALTAYLRGLEWNPLDEYLQDKIQLYWNEYQETFIDFLKSSKYVLESNLFCNKQDFFNFTLGIIDFDSYNFEKARNLLSKISINENNKDLVSGYIASSLWFEEKNIIFTDYEITAGFITLFSSISKRSILKRLDDAISDYPFWGLVKAQKKKLLI